MPANEQETLITDSDWKDRELPLRGASERLTRRTNEAQLREDFEVPAKGEQDRAGTGSALGTDPVSASLSTTFRHSATFGQLCQALCKASLEFGEIKKEAENTYFGNKYADLEAVIAATRPALAKNDLFIVQAPQATEKGILLTTMLMHKSNEWIACDLELPSAKQDAPGKGGSITYARRYSYQSILNIAAEEDDDGNTATGRTQQDRYSKGASEAGLGAINPTQMRAIQSACKTGGKTPEQLTEYLGSLGYESLEELPKAEQNAVVKWALAK